MGNWFSGPTLLLNPLLQFQSCGAGTGSQFKVHNQNKQLK